MTTFIRKPYRLPIVIDEEWTPSTSPIVSQTLIINTRDDNDISVPSTSSNTKLEHFHPLLELRQVIKEFEILIETFSRQKLEM